MAAGSGRGLGVGYELARLRVESGPDRGLELVLPLGPVVIGRGEDADLVLTDSAASRRHALVQPHREAWQVRDLESKTGILVDGAAVESGPLEAGSRLRIGANELVLEVAPATLQVEPVPEAFFEGLRGASLPMRRLFALVKAVAGMAQPVLLRGEAGTGKRSLARALHKLAGRSRGGFERVDCSEPDPGKLRTALLGPGVAPGPGAGPGKRAQAGALARAGGGTLLLDEVGALPPDLQRELVRALEDGEPRPAGDGPPARLRVRLVSTTRRDLGGLVKSGRLRADLHRHLGAITLEVPPLRDRPGDAELLAEHFLPAHVSLEATAKERIRGYSWPGNVRELEETLARAAGLAEGGRITPSDLGISAPAPGAQGAGLR